MELIEIQINVSHIPEQQREILPYDLENIGYEGFVETSGGLLAYISPLQYNRERLISFLQRYGIDENSFTESLLPDKNWNEEWEKNYEPVLIEDCCLIRAPFHSNLPGYPYEIVIMPKMSFGTGHHATTSLMVQEMLLSDFKNKCVLDAGCGTGILAILAEKLGAAQITAVDIDEWSFHNAKENIGLNQCIRVKVIQGDTTRLADGEFDYILANINLNILKSALKNYSALLKPEGQLLMSGILTTDVQALKSETELYDLTFETSKSMNNWAVVRFKKK
jgi:ribosomal protein L11 methyltransferase